ncbi:hypothetical protein V7111_07800 [Neobacillus niacini]|uniref:hypothetical protein n=1 Tax=Neobacillus niacini TaxID=86668 RepID=UPI003000F754
MDLQKYINHLFKSIKNKLSEWLSLKEGETILTEDVYRFLHSVKGTSGTLQPANFELLPAKSIRLSA